MRVVPFTEFTFNLNLCRSTCNPVSFSYCWIMFFPPQVTVQALLAIKINHESYKFPNSGAACARPFCCCCNSICFLNLLLQSTSHRLVELSVSVPDIPVLTLEYIARQGGGFPELKSLKINLHSLKRRSSDLLSVIKEIVATAPKLEELHLHCVAPGGSHKFCCYSEEDLQLETLVNTVLDSSNAMLSSSAIAILATLIISPNAYGVG